MTPGARAPRGWLLGAAALVTLAAFAAFLAPSLAAQALRQAAARRGFAATFGDVRAHWGPSLQVAGLTLVRRANGDTVVFAESLAVRASLGGLLTGRLRPAAMRLAHARILARSARAADPDTLVPEPRAGRARGRREPEDRSARLRAAADALVRLLLVPARTLPALDLRDVVLHRASGPDETSALRLEFLRLTPERGGAGLRAAGLLELDRPVPFAGELHYARDDRMRGDWTFEVPGEAGGERWPLALRVDGLVRQDRRGGRIETRGPVLVRLGEIEFMVSGRIDRAGPAFEIGVAADSLTGETLRRSLPPPVLGPLAAVATRGRWDYRVSLDLDLAHPDSVDFSADVIPRGLAIDFARTRLAMPPEEGPFTAAIHLPRGRVVTRELSEANPHFRRLADLDEELVAAVVTNEDGAFFRHRGFNTEAVKEAIAENIRAGAFRRGAGTITMQLARNLWLGHARTLSRKGQEVMLAWLLEHLTGLSKERLLEIYLNIIEWGPDLHGADEAARYYFDRDAGRLGIDEALFLAILVPSPSKWRWRLDETGALRPFAREQMHFIGRAMIAKGWLDPDRLPAVDELEIRLRGRARQDFFPDPDVAEPRPEEVSALDLRAAAVSLSAAHPPRAPSSR